MVNGDQVEDEFLDMITKTKTEYNIKSTSIAFSKILELAKKGLEHERDEE